MRVAILPTGRTEWHGLPLALGRLFPGHDFFSLPTSEEIVSDPEEFPYPGFTSQELGTRHIENPPEDARDLVERAARAVVAERDLDLVVVVEDVEVRNRGREPLVADVFRAAVTRHLEELGPRIGPRTAALLREKVSFHLAAPMIEAWFFADEGALATAGVDDAAARVLATDPETFEVTDAAYAQASEAECPKWVSAGRKRHLRPKWLDNSQRGWHPKGYVQWLARDGADKGCTRYSERDHGAAALRGIAWDRLLGRPDGQFVYLRSMVADLADRLSQDPVTGPVTGTQAPATSRFSIPQIPVLRNL